MFRTAHPSAFSLTESHLRDYIALLKPRVMSLVVFSGVVGLVVAPGTIRPLTGLLAILCIALAAGGSAAVNMWYDRDIDAIMLRTRNRPLPQGRVEPQAALELGVALILLSTTVMAAAVNVLAAVLLAGAAAFYIFVYTIWLKRRTPWNIVVGGAAGAFPPLIGWVAVTGHITLPATMLFLLIFFWTPPHFWSLALYRNDDYRRANIPMLPVVAGERRTKIEMLIYTLILFPISLTPSLMGFAGMVYGTGAALLSSLFIVCAVRVLRDSTHRTARQMFGFSIAYLTLILCLLLADWGIRGLS